MGMGIRCWDQLDDISSAWLIGLSSEDMTLTRLNPDTGLDGSLSDASEASLPEDRRLVYENEQLVKKTYQIYIHLIESFGAKNHYVSHP